MSDSYRLNSPNQGVCQRFSSCYLDGIKPRRRIILEFGKELILTFISRTLESRNVGDRQASQQPLSNATVAAMSSSQPASSIQSNPMLQSYQAWSERTPYITRISTITLVAIYIISFFLPLTYYLANIPYYTLYKYQIFRVVTSPLVGNSIFMLLLILLTYPALGLKMEASLGSGAFLSMLFTIDVLVNLSFLLLSTLAYIFGVNSLRWECGNFWLILFTLLTIDCMQVQASNNHYDVMS